MNEFISHSRTETIEIAKKISATFCGGETVLLDGEMGAGKTVFAKGVALGLDIDDEVTSPTYAYMNEYEGRLTLYHYDCYRIESVEQAENLGLGEYFYMGGVALVEWSQNIAPLLPDRCIHITIEKLSQEERRITVL